MCPEYERVERIVQLMVDGSEKVWAKKVEWSFWEKSTDVGIDITLVGFGHYGAF